MTLAVTVLLGGLVAFYMFDVSGCTIVIGDTLTTLVGVSCPAF